MISATRLGWWFVVSACLTMLTACGPTEAEETKEAEAAEELSALSEWDSILEAAKEEGEVVVWSGAVGLEANAFLKDAFESAYPEIEVILFQARSSDRDARFIREYEAGVAEVDIFNSGSGGANAQLKPAGMLQDMRPFLILPEVTDLDNWQNQELIWVDDEDQYILQSEVAYVPALVVHESVDPSDLQSWSDLFDPKWRGKLVTTDPRQSGFAFGGALFLYYAPGLGPDFAEQFYGDTEITFAEDERGATELVASGEKLIGFAPNPVQVDALKELDVNLRYIPQLTVDEQPLGWYGGSTGILSIPNLDPLPHPNAATVYINWFYSREGQQALVDIMQTVSARTDVDISGLPDYLVSTSNGIYINANHLTDPEKVQTVREAISSWLDE